MQNYPATTLVILAGGKAKRMNGVNKLLQRFDHEIQLLKIYSAFDGLCCTKIGNAKRP